MDPSNVFFIKGMVCDRCVSVIKSGIHSMGFGVERISLGKISLASPPDEAGVVAIKEFLADHGFELISDRETRIINRVKSLVTEIFSQHGGLNSKAKFSTMISESLNMNYDTISEVFSSSEGMTLEQYIIHKRLEKVKELMVYTDSSLTEIAHLMGFSSVNHLSRQFKELTGMPPSLFKSLRAEKRKLSEQVPKVVQ